MCTSELVGTLTSHGDSDCSHPWLYDSLLPYTKICEVWFQKIHLSIRPGFDNITVISRIILCISLSSEECQCQAKDRGHNSRLGKTGLVSDWELEDLSKWFYTSTQLSCKGNGPLDIRNASANLHVDFHMYTLPPILFISHTLNSNFNRFTKMSFRSITTWKRTLVCFPLEITAIWIHQYTQEVSKYL